MTEAEILDAIARLDGAFRERLNLDVFEVADLVGGNTRLAARCLAFLRDRGELLVSAAGPSVYHRESLSSAIHESLRHAGPAAAAQVAARLEIPTAIACEALGWLTRDGAVSSRVCEEGTIYCSA